MDGGRKDTEEYPDAGQFSSCHTKYPQDGVADVRGAGSSFEQSSRLSMRLV
jgi:hypothetical protein